MSIRTIDFQTIIPKSPEVQRIKHAEQEVIRNNINIDIRKNQEQNDRKIKQVNESQKAYKAKISDDNNKEKQKKHKNDGERKNSCDFQKEDDNKKMNNSTKYSLHSSIDIKI